MNRPLWLMAVLALVLALPPKAQAHDNHRHRNRHGNCRDLDALFLSENQQQAVAELKETYSKKILHLRRQIMFGQVELRHLLRDPQADEGRIRAKTADIGAMQQQFWEQSIDYQLAIRSVLTAEQAKQWCTLVNTGPPAKGWRGPP